jgi:hypothetical protein
VNLTPAVFVSSRYSTELGINGSANRAGNAFWDPIVLLSLAIAAAK